MGLSNVLGNALSGMQVTQSALDVVSRNVANSGTPGYHKQSVSVTSLNGDVGSYATSTGVQRAFDQSLQTYYTSEVSDSSASKVQSSYLDQLQTYIGQPGSDNSLDTVYNTFQSAMTALTASPDDYSVRATAVTDAQALTSTLNQLSSSVQGLRQQANAQIASDVTSVNQSLAALAKVNIKLADQSTDSTTRAGLLDQRDRLVAQVAGVIDVKTTYRSDGTVALATRSGVGLLDQQASVFKFQPAGALSGASQFSMDDAANGVGTLTLTTPSGLSLDLVKQKVVQSGELAGLLNLRDNTLVTAQGQLDDIAAGLAQAVSTVVTPGTTVTAGAENGQSVDLADVQAGNDFVLDYTQGGVSKSLKVVRVDDTSKLPINYIDAPGTQIVGMDFSGGAAGVASQLNGLLGTGFTASGSGDNLQVLNDGTSANLVKSLTTETTSTATQGAGSALSLFVDSNNSAFTNSLDGTGQKLGFAGRIAVNSDVVDDNSLLVQSVSGASLGDATRATTMADQLGNMNFSGNPANRAGTAAVLNGNVSGLVSQMMDYQGNTVSAALSDSSTHSDALDAINSRMTSETGVNTDDEMARLVVLQNAYAANARVVSTVQTLLTSLMNAMQ